MTAPPLSQNLEEPKPQRSLARASVVAVAATSYCAYVGAALVLAAPMFSLATNAVQWSPATITLPLTSAPISIPALPIPFKPLVESPLALIPDWKGTERINVLLMGVDQRDDERERGLPTRTDTIMVVSIDPVQKTAAMTSFPRDLWVAIPGFGEDRINAAYRYGELRRVDGGGPGVAARTIEHNFGLRTTHYATVDFRGFQEIVNTLGGIIIDVPRPIKDDEYPTDTYGIERVFFAPGPQLMDGATALKYARTRHADSDFGRMARQQQVLLAIRDRALRLNLLPRLPTLAEQAVRTVQTNFAPAELLSLAKLATEIEMGAIGSLVIDYQLVTPFQGEGGASLQLPKRDEIRRAIQRAIADPRLIREASRIEITSTSGRAQLARRTADRLAAEGLQVVRRTTMPGPEPETTRVLVYADKPRSQRVVLDALGLPQHAVEPGDGEANVDIRIVLGQDSVAPDGG